MSPKWNLHTQALSKLFFAWRSLTTNSVLFIFGPTCSLLGPARCTLRRCCTRNDQRLGTDNNSGGDLISCSRGGTCLAQPGNAEVWNEASASEVGIRGLPHQLRHRNSGVANEGMTRDSSAFQS